MFIYWIEKDCRLMFVLLKDAKLACYSALSCSRAALPLGENTSSSTPTLDLLEVT
jgi:hypothetical protein